MSDSSPSENTSPPPRKRRWLRRLAVTGIIALILVPLINGPITRFAAKSFITSYLEKQGAHGSLEISGNASSGLILKNAHFTGNQGIKKLSFDSLGVSYRLTQLIDRKIDRIESKNLTLEIDLAAFPPAQKKETKTSQRTLPEILRSAQTLYEPITIDIENVDITILQDKASMGNVTFSALRHSEKAKDTFLEGFQATTSQGSQTPIQNTTLTWTENQLSLDGLSLLPEVAIQKLSLLTPSNSNISATGDLLLAGGKISISSPSPSEVSLTLTENSIDLATLGTLAKAPAKLGGQITSIECNFSQLDQKIDSITGTATLSAKDLSYSLFSLKKADFTATLADQKLAIATTITRKQESATFHFTLPLSGIENPADFQKINGRTLYATADISSLSDSLGNADLDGSAHLEAALILDLEQGISNASAQYSTKGLRYSNEALPQLNGSAHLQDQVVTIAATANDKKHSLNLTGDFSLHKKSYTYLVAGELPQTSYITGLIQKIIQLTPSENISLAVEGHGNLDTAEHTADLFIPETTFHASSGEDYAVSLQLNTNWPSFIHLPHCAISSTNGSITSSIKWENQTLSIPRFIAKDSLGPILSLTGDLPLTMEVQSLKQLIAQSSPIQVHMISEEFSLERLKALAPLPAFETINGLLNGEMSATGTYAKPRINGKFNARNLLFQKITGLQPIDITLNAKTQDNTLYLNGLINEGKSELAAINGALPLSVSDWLNETTSFQNTPIDLHVSIEKMDLQRFKNIASQLTMLDGTADINLSISGTANNPILNGSAQLDVKRIRLNVPHIPDLRDSQLNLSFQEKIIRIEPSTFNGSGGIFDIRGYIDIGGEAPSFDVYLSADKALVFRNDDVNIRSDGKLHLIGSLNNATLSGDLSLVESLYYKDLELIPFGIPAQSIPEPTLPRVTQTIATQSIPIPEPYANWRLNINLSTKDPVLIRGNLATGMIKTTGKALGTFSNPQISVDASLINTEVELPLSKLSVKRGSIRIRPESGFIPLLNIRGESKVGNHRIFAFVTGKADNANITFTSNPPLPESEILTLLASGATSSTLEDSQVASMKAFQLFINELGRKARAKNEDSLATTALDTLSKLDLKVGENDPFSGRRFNSATLQLTSRVYASAAFDQNGNSRGIFIYSLRF